MSTDYRCPIVFCAGSSALPSLQVLLYSICANNKGSFVFYLIADKLRPGELSRFKHFVQLLKTRDRGYCTLQVIETDSRSMLSRLECTLPDYHGSAAPYLKIFLPDILKEVRDPSGRELSQVIVLDCDMLCRGSLDELFAAAQQVDFAGAVQDKLALQRDFLLLTPQYFNPGMLVLNLKALQDFNFTEKALDIARNNLEQLQNPPADILCNALLDVDITLLPERFNEYRPSKGEVKKAVLLHYVGAGKPWHRHMRWRLKKVYWLTYAFCTWALRHGVQSGRFGRSVIFRLLSLLRGFFNLYLSLKELIVGKRQEPHGY